MSGYSTTVELQERPDALRTNVLVNEGDRLLIEGKEYAVAKVLYAETGNRAQRRRQRALSRRK